MLIKIMEVLQPKNDLKIPHRGVVVDNNDPLKLGRVKATIKGLIEDTSNNNENLPWIICINSNFLQDGNGSISPPKIGSKIRIKFEYDDIYFLSYDGYWIDKTNSPCVADGFDEQFKNNYPNVYGFQDDVGNYEIVDKTEGFSEKGYKSGVKIKVDNNADYSLTGVRNGKYNYSSKLEVECNNIKLGNLSTAKPVVLEGHLDKFDRLANAVNTAFSSLAILDSLLAGAYSSTVLAPFQIAFTTPTPIPELGQNKSNETKLS